MHTTVPFSSQGGDDFESEQFELDFAAGQTRAEFNITIIDDNLVETAESFQLLLSIPDELISKGVQVGPNAEATVAIMDNDGELVEVYARLLHVHTCTWITAVPLSLMLRAPDSPYIIHYYHLY